jgi:CBS domain-containing protein
MDLTRNLRIDSVSRLFPALPQQIAPVQPVSAAAELMTKKRTGCLLVCDAGTLVGIVTERDVARRVMAAGKPLHSPVAECMTPRPVTVQAKDSVQMAIRRMQEGGYRHLPIVDESGAPVGVLSIKQVIHYLVEHFPATVRNLPPAVPIARRREGA